MVRNFTGRCVHKQRAGFWLKFTGTIVAFFGATKLLFAPAPPTPPNFTSIIVTSNVATMTFTGLGSSFSGTNYQLIGSSNATGSYTNVPGATNFQIASNTFRVVVTNYSPAHYYRIQVQ
jgi:hypothetical protein